MTLRVVSWNINSVRLRLPLLKTLCEQIRPDIVCLQETKVEDALFPMADLQALGFGHVLFCGQKSYNGVAILSNVRLEPLGSMDMTDATHKRHIGARLPDGSELHNFYVPAGGDIPDPEQNPSFAFKLRFVEEMTRWALSRRNDHAKMIILGDFNIAPLPHDVWSHKQLLKIVSHTPGEVERLDALKDSLGWCDVARHFVSPEEKLYSWWSYRNRDWRRSDRGRRLDHLWVTPNLMASLQHFNILKDMRDGPQPSDHVPVMADLTLDA